MAYAKWKWKSPRESVVLITAIVVVRIAATSVGCISAFAPAQIRRNPLAVDGANCSTRTTRTRWLLFFVECPNVDGFLAAVAFSVRFAGCFEDVLSVLCMSILTRLGVL